MQIAKAERKWEKHLRMGVISNYSLVAQVVRALH